MKRINFHLEKKRGFATVAAGAALAATLTATMTSGVSYANSGTPQGLPPGAVSADGEFFTPGPNTIVKRNAGEATPGKLSMETRAVNPGPAGTTEAYWVQNAHRIGQSCGTGLLSQTSGYGKTTLVLTVEKSVAATVTKEIGVDYKAISAGMGWSVTNSYTVKNETRYEVPAGKWGSVQAFPLYDVYLGDVYRMFGSDTGKDVYAYKPVGVCFNSWNQ